MKYLLRDVAFSSGEIVALKKLKMEKEKEGFPITSLREINMLLKAKHPNIVFVRVSLHQRTPTPSLVFCILDGTVLTAMLTLQLYLLSKIKEYTVEPLIRDPLR